MAKMKMFPNAAQRLRQANIARMVNRAIPLGRRHCTQLINHMRIAIDNKKK